MDKLENVRISFNKMISYIKKLKEKASNNVILSKSFIIIPIIIGIVTFIIIYGLAPLDVKNDKWILSGYDEADIKQHYAGWIAYRNSQWKFPLGIASNMAIGTGTIISFTDSIPIVAIIFKLFNSILPKTFQYFGIFTLLCYILQSIAAFKIIKLKTNNIMYSSIGTILFSFAPILMERSFRHTALGAQWLILFSIYFYLKYRQDNNKRVYLWYLLLEILAIGIHPYFLPMVACFALGCVIHDFINKKYISIIFLVVIQIITYLFGFLIGVLGSGITSSREGFGFFSMNINSIINPTSCGGYMWSSFLRVKPQILGNYDGFNYLGVGILIFIILLVTINFLLNKKDIVMKMIKNNLYLIFMSIGLTFFAISNVVTFNDKILFNIHIPNIVSKLCGIFRASSRMFYPVYYLIFLFLIICLWKILRENRKKYAYYTLIFVVLIQLLDIHYCVIQKHQSMNKKENYYSYIEDSKLNRIAENTSNLLIDGNLELQLDRDLAIFAFKNDMSTYSSVANSGIYNKSFEAQNDLLEKIKNSGDIGSNMVVTANSEVANLYTKFENIDVYEIEGKYFIFKKK